jgi:hypothetical protein
LLAGNLGIVEGGDKEKKILKPSRKNFPTARWLEFTIMGAKTPRVGTSSSWNIYREKT